ncbi:MAG TPA: hypothetical protein VEH50_09875 [Methylomirabilota bacterium]|nr:hypothetical protein [Methylomirabilota bacterium]
MSSFRGTLRAEEFLFSLVMYDERFLARRPPQRASGEIGMTP